MMGISPAVSDVTELTDWRKIHRLSQRMTSLCIMETQFRPPFNPSIPKYHDVPKGFMGSHMMPRDASLPDSCAPDRSIFF